MIINNKYKVSNIINKGSFGLVANGYKITNNKEVIIKRIQGDVTPDLTNFIAGIPFVSVAAGVNRKSVPIDTFGTFTYMARTRDTSGNFSETELE